MNLKFKHMDLISNSMKTPAYPSGHSLQSRLIAEYYGKKYPEHKKELIDRADECGKQRIYAGWHYPSDHTESVKIAKRLINDATHIKQFNLYLSFIMSIKLGLPSI